MPITKSELSESIEEIQKLASNKSKFEFTELECEPVFDVLNVKLKLMMEVKEVTLGRNPYPVWYPCIQKMLDGSLMALDINWLR